MLNSSHPPALREIFAHSAVLLPRVLASLASLALVASALCAQPVHAQPVDAPLLRIDTGAHNAAIRALGIDAAGRYAVTASDDKTARVWDLASGRLLQTLRPPVGADNNGRLFAAAMTPDAATVAVGGWSADNDVYLFERASGTMIQRITGLPNTITQLAFAPDGKLLLIGLWGQHGVRLFGTSSGCAAAMKSTATQSTRAKSTARIFPRMASGWPPPVWMARCGCTTSASSA